MKYLIGNKCPECSSEYVARSHRTSVQRVLSMIQLYPYRCDACGHRFMLLGETRNRPTDHELKQVGQR